MSAYFKDEIETVIHLAEQDASKGDYLAAIYKLTDALTIIVQRLLDEQ